MYQQLFAALSDNFDGRCQGYMMGYSKFMQELHKGIEGKIVAYSRRDNEEGCLIYLKDLEQRIFVPADVIERKRDEAIRVLREKIREGIKTTPVLILLDAGKQLVFEIDKAGASSTRTAKRPLQTSLSA